MTRALCRRRNATQQRLLQTISALKGFVRALERRLEGHFVPTRSCAPCSHFVPDTEVNVLSVDIQGSLAIKTRQYSGKRFIFYTTVLFWHGHRNNQNTSQTFTVLREKTHLQFILREGPKVVLFIFYRGKIFNFYTGIEIKF